MKLVAEYLDRAMQFERMAEEASDPKLKTQFLQQCEAYRKLATKRAANLNAPPPEGSKPTAR
jgi:hypothetical protein